MLTSAAQDTPLAVTGQDTLRPFSVKVVDRRGKPLSGLVVSVKRQDKAWNRFNPGDGPLAKAFSYPG